MLFKYLTVVFLVNANALDKTDQLSHSFYECPQQGTVLEYVHHVSTTTPPSLSFCEFTYKVKFDCKNTYKYYELCGTGLKAK